MKLMFEIVVETTEESGSGLLAYYGGASSGEIHCARWTDALCRKSILTSAEKITSVKAFRDKDDCYDRGYEDGLDGLDYANLYLSARHESYARGYKHGEQRRQEIKHAEEAEREIANSRWKGGEE